MDLVDGRRRLVEIHMPVVGTNKTARLIVGLQVLNSIYTRKERGVLEMTVHEWKSAEEGEALTKKAYMLLSI